MKSFWRKRHPKEPVRPQRKAGHVAKFRLPYRRSKRHLRDYLNDLPEPMLQTVTD